MSKQEEVQELPLTEENLAKNNLTIETEFKNEIVSVEMEIQSSSTEEVVEDVKMLAHLLSLLLSDKKGLERLGVTIPSEVKTVIQKLMEHDSYFDSVEKLMKEIVHDNKIDAKDVPKIMILLADLHTLLKTKKIEFNETLCGDVIKFLFELALKEKLIPVGEEDLELLRCLFDIVDTSVKLLQTDKVGKERKGIVHYMSKYISSCFNK